ncbi:complex 1 protein-domain-containing protein [Pyrenochaeta sp. MPI-SDFR-AT-0127]|nr:complex 1 protein-domain-containing protein [Pyrenochaeta sp. MPI-SDFR-AT-0127]
MTKLSGLQRDVLSLYRQCLRAARRKPDTQSHFRDFAKAGFQKHQHIEQKDFGTIEFLLRRGRNQLESYSDPGIRDIRG